MSRSTPAARGLLDTSAVIDLADLDASGLPSECSIRAITLAELSAGALVATSARERAARQGASAAGRGRFDPLPFDAGCARAFGRVAASLRQAGRKPQVRAYDALIAATADGVPLYTRNSDEFTGIEGLVVQAV